MKSLYHFGVITINLLVFLGFSLSVLLIVAMYVNLKREGAYMSKLDDILFDHAAFVILPNSTGEVVDRYREQIKNLILEIVRAEYHYQDSADELLAKVVKVVEAL